MPDFAVGTTFKGNDRLTPVFKKMGRAVKGFTNTGVRGMRKLDGAMNRVGKRIGNSLIGPIKQFLPMMGVAGIAMGLNKLVDAARMIEDAEAAFTPLIGGAKKAEEMVNKLNETAASTPFQFETLSEATKQLLPVMEGDIAKTIKTLRLLGDTAGGNAQKLESITRGFTKAMLKGKVDMKSLNMIAEAGVPVYTEMAKSMGYSKDQMSLFFKKISTGKIGTEELTKVFEKMTSKGGLFFEGMIIASKTTSGVISTMKDNVILFAAGLGKELLPYVKEIAISLTNVAKSGVEWVKNNKEIIGSFVSVFISVIEKLPYIIGGFAAWKVAMAGVWALKKIMIAFGWIKYLWTMRTAIKKATFATKAWAVVQKVVNFVMSLNPIFLIIAAVVALSAGIIYLVRNWEDVKKSLGDNAWGQGLLFIIDVIKVGIDDLINKFEMLGKLLDGDFSGAMRKTAQSGMMGEITKQEAAKRGMTVNQYLDEKLGSPKAPNEANKQKIDFQGNINVNAPSGTSISSKTRGARPVNMQLVGAQ